MGQQATAIMYGIPHVNGVTHGDCDDGDYCGLLYDLLVKYRRARADDIAAYDAAHPRESWEDPDGRAVIVPSGPSDCDTPALGFYVACGGSGRAGIPYLSACAIDEIPATYTEAYAEAVRRWGEFADWMRANGTELPEPKLYITITETA